MSGVGSLPPRSGVSAAGRHIRSSSVLDRLLSDLSDSNGDFSRSGGLPQRATAHSLPITPMLIALSAKASELVSSNDLRKADLALSAAKAESLVLRA